MITAIEIENFKAIGERVRVELKPLTLLFGANSAGKSTILQVLHYAGEVFERHNLDPDYTGQGGHVVDLGGFRTLVHDRHISRPMRIRFEVRGAPPSYTDADWIDMEDVLGGKSSAGLRRMLDRCSSVYAEIEVVWREFCKGPVVSVYEVGLDGRAVARTRLSEDGNQAELDYIDFKHPALQAREERVQFTLEEEEGVPLVLEGSAASEETYYTVSVPDLETLFREQVSGDFPYRFRSQVDQLGRPSALPEWEQMIELRGADFSLNAALSRILVGPGKLVQNALRNFRYLGPVRAMPPRVYEPPRYPNQERWADGLAAWDTLHHVDEGFIEEVNTWLLARLKSGYSVRLKRYYETDMDEMVAGRPGQPRDVKNRVVIVPSGQGIELQLRDVGTGVSQVLPVVVLALDAQQFLLALEQPELHLHPALQAELGDLFIESALGERRNTFILETHSEHLILRVMRRMRETFESRLPEGIPPLHPPDVAVLYVEPTPNGSVVREMPLNERGELVKAWPGGFFEEGLRELLPES
jgi:hypothetical protein